MEKTTLLRGEWVKNRARDESKKGNEKWDERVEVEQIEKQTQISRVRTTI